MSNCAEIESWMPRLQCNWANNFQYRGLVIFTVVLAVINTVLFA